MKRIVCILLILVMLAPSCALGAKLDLSLLPEPVKEAMTNGLSTTNSYMDETDEEFVRKLVSKASEKTSADLLARTLNDDTLKYVTTLDLSELSDVDGTFLASLPNLMALTITMGSLSDLSVIRKINRLTILCIKPSGLSSLDELPSLGKLKLLAVSGNELTSLDGIKKFKALTTLRAEGNPLSDVSELKSFNKLKALYLGSSRYPSRLSISEINSKGIETLVLNNTGSDALRMLGKLPKLQALSISGSHISSLAPLAPFKNLTFLYLDDCGLNDDTDWSPVCGLAKLIMLDISENDISVFSFLDELKSLYALLADGTKAHAEDLDYPSELVKTVVLTDIATRYEANTPVYKVEYLRLNDLELGDLSFIKSFSELRSLELTNCSFTDWTPLEGLDKLKELKITGNGSLSLSSQWQKLERLELDGIALPEGIGTLADYKKLESLSLRNLGIEDISPLKGLKKLTHLYLGDNKISNVTPLAGLTAVVYMGLENNPIKDITPLKNLKKLEWLSLSGAPVENVAPLGKLTKLSELYIDDIAADDFSAIKRLKKLEVLRAKTKGFTDARVLKGLKNLRWVDCPNVSQSDKELRALLPSSCYINGVESYADTLNSAIESAGDNGGDPTSGMSKSELAGIEHLNVPDGTTDLCFLSKLPNISTLWVNLDGITDFSPLTKKQSIKYLYTRGNTSPEFFKAVVDMKNVDNLIIQLHKTEDLSALNASALRNLTLEIEAPNISLASLQTLSTVENLSISSYSEDVIDYAALGECEWMKSLTINNCAVRNLEPIAALKQLEHLYFDCLDAEDMTPLTQLSNLHEIIATVPSSERKEALIMLGSFAQGGGPSYTITIDQNNLKNANSYLEAYLSMQENEQRQ